MSGTDTGRTLLRRWYAMPGTDVGCGHPPTPVLRDARRCTLWWLRSWRECLGGGVASLFSPYAMSGTDIRKSLSEVRYWPRLFLFSPYAMSGTDVGIVAVRCPADQWRRERARGRRRMRREWIRVEERDRKGKREKEDLGGERGGGVKFEIGGEPKEDVTVESEVSTSHEAVRAAAFSGNVNFLRRF
eukprot:2572222-Rhodomonas_salina.1